VPKAPETNCAAVDLPGGGSGHRTGPYGPKPGRGRTKRVAKTDAGADGIAISVIVPVKNGLPWLHQQLQALLSQRCSSPWEIVVVDNASTDGTSRVVQGYACKDPRLRLVDASSVTGPAATRNLGARAARGDILAFCDADDVVHPGWVESWQCALADADVAAGTMDSWSLNGLTPPCPAVPRPPPQGRQFRFLDAAGSGNMAVGRDVFGAVGGFDEELLVGEDTDLSWRLQLAGYRFTFGEGVISRRERSGTIALLKRSIQYGRSGPFLYRRYRGRGMRAEPLAALWAWVYVIATLPRLVDPQFRHTWARAAGWRIGSLVESCRCLVFFP
jgi:cellulose synthase/poly-beta-1,6-N-acetylglucosamine synthase-like glycosyltransferase